MFYRERCLLVTYSTTYEGGSRGGRANFSRPIQEIAPPTRANMLRSESRYQSKPDRVIRLTPDQETVLQEQFNRWPKALHTADVVLLAAETGLSEADVQDWYNMRLAQWRKEQGLGLSLGLH